MTKIYICEPVSDQPTGSDTPNTPPEAPESSTNDPSPVPVESQNPPINQSESEAPETNFCSK